jgi:D-alanyl-D-alanine carboxypeptidase
MNAGSDMSMLHRRDLLLTGAGAALASLGASRAFAADTAPPSPKAVIDSYATRGLSDGVVLVARDGKPLFRQGFGFANREWNIASDPDAEFRIGSVTKQFTAAAILLLVQDGKLSLDAPIGSFYENLPPAWRPITVRHLLLHTSGIPNFTAIPGIAGPDWMGKKVEYVIDAVRGLPLEGVPGAKFSYDNTGYVILGGVVAKASGQSLGAVLKARVFAPLGMAHTGFVSDEVLPRRASGYTRDGDRWLNAGWMSNVIESGAGAIYSTLDDLLKWDRALYDATILRPDALKQMFTDYGHGFGFGYVIDVKDGHRVWWHNGHIDGFSAILARYPDDRLTVIILSNDDAAPVEKLSHDLAALYLSAR